MKDLSEQAKHDLVLSQFSKGLGTAAIVTKLKGMVGRSTVFRTVKSFKEESSEHKEGNPQDPPNGKEDPGEGPAGSKTEHEDPGQSGRCFCFHHEEAVKEQPGFDPLQKAVLASPLQGHQGQMVGARPLPPENFVRWHDNSNSVDR